MGAPRGGESAPLPPFYDDEAFRNLVNRQGKKLSPPEVPKFIKKLDAIPEIAFPEEQPIKITLALEERGLVGQFMGLWPSSKNTDDWI
jgi:hypothetical protein